LRIGRVRNCRGKIIAQPANLYDLICRQVVVLAKRVEKNLAIGGPDRHAPLVRSVPLVF